MKSWVTWLKLLHPQRLLEILPNLWFKINCQSQQYLKEPLS